MNRAWWWLVDRISQALEPSERDAVRGDFAESGESGGRALLGILGLVVRRQLLLWKDWRPWLGLIGLVGPVGVLLTIRTLALLGGLSYFFWASYPAMTTGEQILLLGGDLVLVPVLSWTAGFVLGSLTRRTLWLHSALFCLWLPYSHARVAHYVRQGIVFALLFEAVLFFFPAVLGARWGIRKGTIGLRRPICYAPQS
jgi:hypothetical protein